MRIVKQFTRKKNAFFREIKFNLINYRYRNKSMFYYCAWMTKLGIWS